MSSSVKPEVLKINKYTQEEWNEEPLRAMPDGPRLLHCKVALEALFPDLAKEPVLLLDYARIIAMLIDVTSLRQIDALEVRCRQHAIALVTDKLKTLPPGTDPKSVAPSVSKLLRRLMVDLEFPDVSGVYFVGDAGSAFGRAVKNKVLFVDGISGVHGEFAHTIQWLYIAYLNRDLAENSVLRLHHKVCDLYARSLDFSSAKGKKLLGEKGGKLVEKEDFKVWDVCVDCFMPIRLDYGGRNMLECFFSNSMRSPAVVQAALTSGSGTLRGTLLGKLLIGRLRRLEFKGRSLELTLHDDPDQLQQYYKARAQAKFATKPRVVVPGAPGALVKDPFPAGVPIPRQLSGAAKAEMAAASGGLLTPDDIQAFMEVAKRDRARANRDDAPPPNDLEGLWLGLHKD